MLKTKDAQHGIKLAHHGGIGRGRFFNRVAPAVDLRNGFGDVQVIVHGLAERREHGVFHVNFFSPTRGKHFAPAVGHAPGIFQALHGEVGVGTVVGADELQTQGRGLNSLVRQVSCGKEVALALTHLGPFNKQEPGVKPHCGVTALAGFGGGVVERAAGLGNLALVVWEDVVLAAAVQVDEGLRSG